MHRAIAELDVARLKPALRNRVRRTPTQPTAFHPETVDRVDPKVAA